MEICRQQMRVRGSAKTSRDVPIGAKGVTRFNFTLAFVMSPKFPVEEPRQDGRSGRQELRGKAFRVAVRILRGPPIELA